MIIRMGNPPVRAVLLGQTPFGTIRIVPDESVTIDVSTSPATIRAVRAAAWPEHQESWVITPLTEGQAVRFASVPAGVVQLFRNGLLQTEGIDYDRTGAAVTFRAVDGIALPLARDILAAFY